MTEQEQRIKNDLISFRDEPKLLKIYVVNMVQYELDGIYVCVTPTI